MEAPSREKETIFFTKIMEPVLKNELKTKKRKKRYPDRNQTIIEPSLLAFAACCV